MTVKELIEQLQKLDPNLHVFTEGYEGGYNDIDEDYDVLEIALDVHSDWWYGPHESVESVYDAYQVEKSEDGIIIG